MSDSHTDGRKRIMLSLKGKSLTTAEKQASEMGLPLTTWIRTLVFQKNTEYLRKHPDE